MNRPNCSLCALSAIALVGILVTLVGCFPERKQFHYGTVGELREDRRMGAWIPAWLPSSCRDVDLLIDIDTHAAWARMTCSMESWSIAEGRTPLARDNWKLFATPPVRLDWWPKGLTHRSTKTIDLEITEGMFSGKDAQGNTVPVWDDYVAIDRSSGDVYYWRPGLHY